MTVNYEYNNDVSSSNELEAFINEKLEKLFINYEFLVRADVFFKIENTPQRSKGMITAIRLSAPGPRLYAEASTKNFHKSASQVIDALKHQLEKRKNIMQTH